MDPFILARANPAIEQARDGLRAQALQYVEAEKGALRGEARAFAQQVQSGASRVFGESQYQVVQFQKELNEIRGEASQFVQMANSEVESIRSQAPIEVLQVQRESQSQISLFN